MIVIKRTKRRKTRRNQRKRIVLKMNPSLNLLIIGNKKIKIIFIDTLINNY